MNVLVADLCILEPQAETHAHEMFNVLSDPAIYEFENVPPPSEEWLAMRFKKLESGQSPDGKQHWLNWVVRVTSDGLAGYVQATVLEDDLCYVAYELASNYWRRGLGRSAVTAMLHELAAHYGVRTAVAVLKAKNFRSQGLLLNLGFAAATEKMMAVVNPEPDEIVMVKSLSSTQNAA